MVETTLGQRFGNASFGGFKSGTTDKADDSEADGKIKELGKDMRSEGAGRTCQDLASPVKQRT